MVLFQNFVQVLEKYAIASVSAALTYLSNHSRQVKSVGDVSIELRLARGFHTTLNTPLHTTTEQWLDMVEEINEDLR